MRLLSLVWLVVAGWAGWLLMSQVSFAQSAEPEVGSEWIVAPRCYRYAFVSDRRNGADNLFFSDSCTNQIQQLTSNLDPKVQYSSLSMSRSIPRIAFNDREWLNFVDADTGSISLLNNDSNYNGQPDFVAMTPAWGPNNEMAFVESDRNHQGLRLRINDQWPYLSEQSRTILSPDPTGSRVFDRLDWIPQSGKIVISMASRGESLRLYIVNTSSGDIWPLQENDASGSFGMFGQDPAVSLSGKLAFIRDDHLWTCDLDLTRASESRPQYFCKNSHVVSEGGRYRSPCWTYDNQKIIFSLSRNLEVKNDAGADIYMISPIGTELQQLTDYSGKDTDPVCFPFGY